MERGGRILAVLLARFREALPALDLSAYNRMREHLRELAVQLWLTGDVPLSSAMKALAGQVIEHDLPRLAAIAVKLNEEEAPKFFSAIRLSGSELEDFALDSKKKTTIRREDFNEAIDRIVNRRLGDVAQLIKQDAANWLAQHGGGDVVGIEDEGNGARYILRKGLGGWELVFDGKKGGLLPDWKGLRYVAYLLKNPPSEPIHGSELGKRVLDDVVIVQRNLAADDPESFAGKKKAERECRAILEDDSATEVEKAEASLELADIGDWARKHLRGTEGNEQKQVRAIRQAIRRLLENLAIVKDDSGKPNAVVQEFGRHVERYLWQPSSRSGGGRNSRVRSGLAGRFTYEPPDGLTWSG